MELENYNDIMKDLKLKKRQKHLLLGNGFSMAYNKEIFSYNALSKFIYSSSNSILRGLFETIKSSNFEQIMRELELCKNILKNFETNTEIISQIDIASNSLKNELINAVQDMHPEHVYKIPQSKQEICAKFLNTYLDGNGSIFSTNYDLLLYWVMMRDEKINAIDGFGRLRLFDDQEEYSDLLWGINKNKQNIYYLHGALHLFDSGTAIIKEKYNSNKNEYLLENIKKRMKSYQYPIFVTAGNGANKLNHIMHNQYLSYCYDRLSSIQGSLICFGFAFGEYDTHIIDAINKAAMKRKGGFLNSIYIAVYDENDRKHIESIAHKFNCAKVHIFDSKTVPIWTN